MQEDAMQLDEVVVTSMSGKVAGVNTMQKLPGRTKKPKPVTRTLPLVINQVERATNVEFAIDQTYSIPSSGKHFTVEMVSPFSWRQFLL